MKIEDELKTNRFKNEQHKAILNIYFTSYWFKTLVTSALKPFGITPEQFNVMRILKGSEETPLCVKSIAERMIERNSNVSRIIDKLESKAYIKKSNSEKDRREVTISLSSSGNEVLQNINQIIDSLQENSIHLEEHEAKELNQLLDKMRD